MSSHEHNEPDSQPNTDQQLQRVQKDLESMVLKYARSERENLQNKSKIDELDAKLKRVMRDNDQLANRIKILTNDKNSLSDNLSAKVAQLTVLEQKNTQLNNTQGIKLKEAEERVTVLENAQDQLLKQIESYRSKEGELLEFSERLSMKHLLLQSELDTTLKMIPNYKRNGDINSEPGDLIRDQLEELKRQVFHLAESLKIERKQVEKLNMEKEKIEIAFKNRVDELENDIKVARRKHLIAVKELLKEKKQLMEQVDKLTKPTNQITT